MGLKFFTVHTLIRFADFLLYEFGISLICGILLYSMLVPSVRIAALLLILVADIIYALLNIYFCRRQFMTVAKPWLYLLINFTAYFIFALISLIVYKYIGRKAFSWLYMPTKIFTFIGPPFTEKWSLLAFHASMVILILLTPLGMGMFSAEEKPVYDSEITEEDTDEKKNTVDFQS